MNELIGSKIATRLKVATCYAATMHKVTESCTNYIESCQLKYKIYSSQQVREL